MKRIIKTVGRLGSTLYNHKGTLLAGIVTLAAAEFANVMIRRRIARLRAEEDEKIEEAQEETQARAKKRAQRREAFHTPQLSKENTVRH
jgi:hypothetical protein